ncbi:hypothetical protein [Neptunomonas sp.]|uniref:hypothetical protein n=1 Tax=Neptunomonas sp. TaxID=1971898 RepID=UPI0025D38CE6|nr:hypothetical protein [Neptunomonas sp.]
MFKRLTGQPLVAITALMLSVACQGAENTDSPKTAARLAERSSTENLIPMLDAYYSELNRQLDKQLKNRKKNPQQPFAKLPSAHISNTDYFTPSTLPQNTPESVPFKKMHSSLPKMNFRGVTQSQGKKMALLEIENLGTFVVKKGDKIGLQQIASSGAVLHILEINELNLIVETGSYGQQMVVQ